MQEYKDISGEIWGTFKKYLANLPMTEQEWSACISEFDAIASKYEKHQQYAVDYAVVCCNELERLWKEQHPSSGR